MEGGCNYSILSVAYFSGNDGQPKIDNLFIRLPWLKDSAPIANWTVHRNFSAETRDFDLAVARLASPLDLDATGACLVCLTDGAEEGKNVTVLAAPS